MFHEIANESFDEREKRILKFWQEKRVFERSVEGRKDHPVFTIYDGPPFATGLPHYGHLLAGTIKDVVPRYKTMKGFCVPRRFGWDCHGLPIENEIEKAHGLSGAKSIEEFGIAKFNEECRSIVLRYTEEWKSTVHRMGRCVDFSQTYRTMDLSFMESVWWVFKRLFEKGLVYEGFRVMPFSAKLGTPLSNFEAGENYKDVDDPALTVTFPLLDDPETALLAWTTTPWTLVSNLAVMAGPDIDYVRILDRASGKKYILAKNCLPSFYKNESDYAIEAEFKGQKLQHVRYLPILPYFAHQTEAFKVILEENVATDEGTGLVHSAPAFGEMDFYACQREGIPLVCPVDNNGRFSDEIAEYKGLFVKDADKEIIKRLKHEGRVFHHSTIRHRYPFCWRSDTPLIYKAVSTWFVAVEQLKSAMLRANTQIHWTPEHLKYGRFGKWLEGARDWNISRNRYWGTPIPIWRAEDGELLVVGSIAELETLAKTKVTDLHRHFIDDIPIEKGGKIYRRIPEVFDCWFESGSMPYAQNHYPFENQELFEKNFPADFIAEGLDQTRGWFYTLTVLAAALFDKPAFNNVICNGIMLAEDGAKMSKRLRNYPDPLHVIEKYGADAVRLYMMHSPAVKADDLRFKESGVELVLRQILIPLWNAYSFFITYARLYHWKPPSTFTKPKAVIDRWVLSVLHQLIHEVEEGMDAYDLSRAVEPFVAFIDNLTNWYIRRSRRRFWEEDNLPDRDLAFETLYQVLLQLTKITAPFVPFISDAIYRNLRTPEMPESVHLCDYPKYLHDVRDVHLEQAMDAVMQTVSLGHSLRKENKIKVRQPLREAHVASDDPNLLVLLKEQQGLIADELNVKQVHFSSHESQFVSLIVKPNFRVLGKKVGKNMREAQEKIAKIDRKQILSLFQGKEIAIDLEGEPFTITPDDVQIERKVHDGIIAANVGNITIALDTELSEELLSEGLAREIVNKINTMRREGNFDVAERIHVKMQTTERVKQCVESYRDYISKEILALSFDFAPCAGTEWDLNGEPAIIELKKN